ncbi:MAG TPA: MarR family transcriptional regulator [Ornithinibacter sp.]|nr:MarR family transcriptional regulator [Ornithinibacter sp.]
MAPTTTPVRPSMTRTQRDRLTSDLRMACMRISRRIRFESTAPVAPHQFSVLVRLEEQVRTPKELAAIEKVSAPSMTRTVNALVGAGLVARADDPADGRQVILSLTPEGRATIRDTRRRRDQWLAVRLERLSDDERRLLAEAAELLERMAAE